MDILATKDADLNNAKAEALTNAIRAVASYLQHPDQLDKVEQYRRRVMRNKASVEARLKNAVQSQLDDVRSGLHQLQSALQDVKRIKKNMVEVDETFRSCTHLGEELDAIKRCHMKHSEAAKACQHLNQIFEVPTTVSYTEKCIENGKLLEAHQKLSELEATRDEVLLEVHKMEKTNTTSKKEAHLVEAYFAGIHVLSTKLAKQLVVILERILSTVRVDPAKLVTALRIIEREERADKLSEERRLRTGFSPPGRPKKLRANLYETLETAVDHRFESLQIKLEERNEDKMWLVKHLERTRQTMVEDLIVIKTSCQPCFPPSYNIFDKYVKMYHKVLSKMLEDLVCMQSLESDECVSILTWLKEYDGPDLMMHPELQIDTHTLNPLLKPPILEDLKKTYFETTSKNIEEWMNKLAETDTKDWEESSLPDSDGDGYFITPLPVFLFQMVEQNLQVGAQAGEECQIIVLKTCIETMQQFQRKYKEAVETYRKKHLLERNEPQYFVQFVVAIANNCLKCAQFTNQLKERMMNELQPGKFGEDEQQTFKSIVECFHRMAELCCKILLDEVVLDTEDHFKKMLTRSDWYKKPLHVETILATVEDYNNDFTHIMPEHHEFVLLSCLDRVIVGYITAMTERRMKFKNYGERKHAAEQINKESGKISETFMKLGINEDKVTEKCAVILMLSEIIKLKDAQLLSLEISGVATKYKDFTSDHAMALLAMREDIGKGNISEILGEADLSARAGDSQKEEGLFSQIQIASSSLWDKLSKQ
ncbi:exocyst complex component 3-like [Dendronephthya gigantea]|uniref:exocyst complex component 3-like n=1 Tax=Dendronephthya gigantea TaxID=151771 RepID=UPI00106DA3C5|nr:exocyst complex component 3-like [Dendronephthya gigantea]